MSETSRVKLAEFSDPILSVQNDDALAYDHLVTLEAAKIEEYRRIQREFQRMQDELNELIKS